ncbi:MAG: HEAT repeat domain-containing protein, partial [Cyanobacteriota bacterium]
IPLLSKALKDEDMDVCSSAAYALWQIQSEAAVKVLIQAMEDEDIFIRYQAAYTLDKIRSESLIKALINALKDKNYSFAARYRIADILGQIQSKLGVQPIMKFLGHEGYDYHWMTAEALNRIGSDAAIVELVNDLNHEDLYARMSAAYALGKIASPELLPDLFERLKTDKETNLQIFYTISAIQERCKFYNYTLTQPTPPPVSRKSKPKNSSTKPKYLSLMHILHLSDLHFGTLDQANLWSSQLAEDLRNELDIPQLDALILSGDIANYSTPDEYNAAEQFLNKLRQQFPLTPEQIILVPGNHDINWEQAENAYRIERRKNYKGELREGCYIDRGDIIEVRNEEEYKNRFANFSNFYQAIKGEPYPPGYEQQGILHHLSEQNLLILGLNSAWQLDHHYKTRANIHPIALSNALDQISLNQKSYQNCLKIAVWHHPIHSSGEDRITDAAFLDRLAVAGFRFFLHGHVHEAKTSNYRYDMTKDGRNLDQICAGTFGAPTKELVTGTPWQYNLLKFEGNKLTVRTRCRRKENGTWEPDSIWRQGKGKEPLSYYVIDLL